jgi:hypothetical protein
MNEEQPNTLQLKLFDEILTRFSKKSEAISELMKVLSVNRDGIYRRLRCDTLLTSPELQLLAVHYGISLDELAHAGTNRIFFYYSPYEQQVNSFWDYLILMNRHMKKFVKQPELWVYYSSQEIPIFISMMFPKLFAFKMYIHGLTTWHLEYLQDLPFDFELLNAKEQEIVKETVKIYCTIDSTDFWTLALLQQTLSQIEYLAMEGRFRNFGICQELCLELQELIQHARLMAEAGKKFMPGYEPIEENGVFDLYHSELTVTNTTILSISQQQYGLYNTFDSPNFLFTNNKRLCLQKKAWFKKVKQYSVSMSVHSSKNRNHYFNKLENKIEQTVQRLKYAFS